MTLPPYNDEITLPEAMDQFDSALVALAMNTDIQSALDVNNASGRWIQKLYSLGGNGEGIPNGFADDYAKKIDRALIYIQPMQKLTKRHLRETRNQYDQLKQTQENSEDLARLEDMKTKIHELSQDSGFLSHCLLILRLRKGMARDLVPKVPDHHDDYHDSLYPQHPDMESDK